MYHTRFLKNLGKQVSKQTTDIQNCSFYLLGVFYGTWSCYRMGLKHGWKVCWNLKVQAMRNDEFQFFALPFRDSQLDGVN